MEIIKKIYSFFNIETKPLTAKDAYAYYASDYASDSPTIEKIYSKFFKRVLSEIKSNAQREVLYTLVIYPYWMTLKYKTLFLDDIESLGYTIVYKDNNIVLITIKID